MIYWDHYYSGILLVNLLVVIGLFAMLRFFSGLVTHVNASKELFVKDNPAFGIGLAGATFAITIMLSGTIFGNPSADFSTSVLYVAIFGLLGILLMGVTRYIFTKFTFPKLDISQEIIAGNKAVAIADAGNVLAAAVIIRSIMIWITDFSINGVVSLLIAFVISQFLLTSMTLLRKKRFYKFYKGGVLQEEFQKGNIAVALRYSGQKIGTAFAISMATQLIPYETIDTVSIYTSWFIASIVMIFVWKVLCFVGEKIIIRNVNINEELIDQQNMALGLLQAVIYVSMGLLLTSI